MSCHKKLATASVCVCVGGGGGGDRKTWEQERKIHRVGKKYSPLVLVCLSIYSYITRTLRKLHYNSFCS